MTSGAVPDGLDEDDAVIVQACADLADRTGSISWHMGYTDPPEETPDAPAKWYCHVTFQGARIGVSDMDGPVAAAMALAVRLLRGASCRCGKTVTLLGRNDQQRCLWRILNGRWESSCNEEPIHLPVSARGDMRRMAEEIDKRKRQRKGKRG
jgi:hypothetical protein